MISSFRTQIFLKKYFDINQLTHSTLFQRPISRKPPNLNLKKKLYNLNTIQDWFVPHFRDETALKDPHFYTFFFLGLVSARRSFNHLGHSRGIRLKKCKADLGFVIDVNTYRICAASWLGTRLTAGGATVLYWRAPRPGTRPGVGPHPSIQWLWTVFSLCRLMWLRNWRYQCVRVVFELCKILNNCVKCWRIHRKTVIIL